MSSNFLDEPRITELVHNFLRDSPGRGVELTRGYLRSQNAFVPREHVRQLVRSIDPEGTELRKRKTIKRRVYNSKGIHHVWHMDGWHKLIKYGLVVHAAIDGCSRFVVFCNCSSNNYAMTVLRHFVGACDELNVIPGCVRSDQGGENVQVFRFMSMVYGETQECFIASSSCHNQTMERNWRDMRTSTMQPYKDFFLFLEGLGLNIENHIHMFCLHYMFIPRINESLKEYRNCWNHHGLSTEHFRSPISILYSGQESTGGIPFVVDEMSLLLEELLSTSTDVDFRQVHCEPKFCPLNDSQYALFCTTIQPFTLQDCLQELHIPFFNVIQYTISLINS